MVFEAISFAATLPQLPLPTTVTLNILTLFNLDKCKGLENKREVRRVAQKIEKTLKEEEKRHAQNA